MNASSPDPQANAGEAGETTPDEQTQDDLALLVGHLAEGGTLGDLRGLEPKHYEALYAIGHNHYELGQYEKAIEMFQFLVLMNPWDRRFPMALGSAYQMTGQFKKAMGNYTMAVSLNMMDPIPMFHTAECMIALGHYSEAVDALGFVIRNCKSADQEAYKQRAQGLLPLVQEQAQRQAAPGAEAPPTAAGQG